MDEFFFTQRPNISKGVWIVGNIGRERGSIWFALGSAYLLYPTLYYIGDDTVWMFLMVVASSLSFDTFSKEWRLKPRRKRRLVRRVACLGAGIVLYLVVIGSYLYFNAVITDSEGEEIKLSEALQHFLTSPIWLDLKVGSPRELSAILRDSLPYECEFLSSDAHSGESGGRVEPGEASRFLGYVGATGGPHGSSRRDQRLQGRSRTVFSGNF